MGWQDAPVVGSSESWKSAPVVGGKPAKLGREGFKEAMAEALKEADWGTRQVAGFGTFARGAYEGMKQLFGQGDQTSIEANKQIAESAPVAAIAGGVAATAPAFALQTGLRGAAALGAGIGALDPVEGEQTFENIAKGKAVNAALGGALGAGGQKIANVASNAMARRLAAGAEDASRNAVRNAELQAGLDAGFVADPSMFNRGLGSNVLGSIAGKTATERQGSIQNAEVVEGLVRKVLGVPSDTPLSPELFDQVAKDVIARGYTPIREYGRVPASNEYVRALNAIPESRLNAAESFPAARSPQLEALVEGYKPPIDASSIGIERAQARQTLDEMMRGREMSRIDALQQAGKMQTEAAQQTVRADNFFPVLGMPRVSGRLSNNAEVAPAYQKAASEFADIAKLRGEELSVLQDADNILLSLKDLPTRSFDTNHAVTAIQNLRQEAKDEFRKGDSVLGFAKKKIAGEIENEIERQLSRAGKDGELALKQFREARKKLAQINDIEKATKNGRVDARALARSDYLTDELAVIAGFARQQPRMMQIPESFGANTNAMTAGLGAGFGSVGGGALGGIAGTVGTLGTRLAARNYLLSRMGQRNLIPEYRPSNSLQFGNALLQYAPEFGATSGVQYMGE
jgi:hypothetical protein